jgi:hypothetical protein
MEILTARGNSASSSTEPGSAHFNSTPRGA